MSFVIGPSQTTNSRGGGSQIAKIEQMLFMDSPFKNCNTPWKSEYAKL